MATLTSSDINHLFEALRNGTVPEKGAAAIATGIEKHREEIRRQLTIVENHEGAIKFLRGGYGGGKTFLARLSVNDAQARGFATSFVVVSDNDLRFYKFDEVYRKVMTELSTETCPRGALNDILDRWIGDVEDSLINAGANEDAADFDSKVRLKIGEELKSMTGGKAPPDFIRVIQTIFDLKQSQEYTEAGALISWLSGSQNVASGPKRRADIKGNIGSTDALDYLRGILEIVKAAGYKGMMVVIDEAETIMRMRKDSKDKSLNGLRQIVDASQSYHGLFWLFTGTPDFFDSRSGVAGLAPLHDRIKFQASGGGRFVSLRQPQIELNPFDAPRLNKVAMALRELYPAKDPHRLRSACSPTFIGKLVAEVTKGFKGDVGIVPRQFLREFVNQMDLVDEHPEYDPMSEYGFTLTDVSHTEQEKLDGVVVEQSADIVGVEDVW